MDDSTNCGFYKAVLVVFILIFAASTFGLYQWSQSRMASLLAATETLTQQASKWEATSNSLRAEVDQWKGTSERLRGEAAGLKSEVDQLKGEAGKATKALADLRGKLQSLKDCKLPSLGGIFK